MVTDVNFGRAFFSALILSAFVLACSGDDDNKTGTASAGGSTGDGGTAGSCPAAPAPQKPATACDVTIESPPPSADGIHVSVGTPVSYCSNPPSSGPHYPVWAAFKEYDKAIDWGYLVHSMEHGAVLLLYKCDPPGCPEIVDALRKVRDEAAADPLCEAGEKRIIVAPSPTIPTKVAAAAWGKTYTASCVDAPTLSAFVRDNYAKTAENFCAAGQSL